MALVPTRATVSAEGVANLLWPAWVSKRGVPESIVSDRDPRFTADVWQSLWALLGTHLKMSTADHPETDGQTERVNRKINAIMRTLVSSSGGNWDNKLTYVEFAINMAPSTVTGMLPFMADSGKQPLVPGTMTFGNALTETFAGMIENITTITSIVRDNLVKAAADTWAEDVRRHRRSTHCYNKNDWVLVRSTRLNSESEANHKWSALYVGPYRVLKTAGSAAVVLDLPEHVRAHSTINIENIKPYFERGQLGTRGNIDILSPQDNIHAQDSAQRDVDGIHLENANDCENDDDRSLYPTSFLPDRPARVRRANTRYPASEYVTDKL